MLLLHNTDGLKEALQIFHLPSPTRISLHFLIHLYDLSSLPSLDTQFCKKTSRTTSICYFGATQISLSIKGDKLIDTVSPFLPH